MYNDKVLNTLKSLGFNVYEAKVYLSMLSQANPHTAYEIGKLSRVPRSKVYEVVDNLFRKQFLVQTDNSPKKYLAVDPREVLITIEEGFDSSMEFAKAELCNITKGEIADYILNLIGKESIINKSKDMINRASASILIAVGPNMFSVLDNELRIAEGRGVEIYLVYYGNENISYKNVYKHTISEPDIKNWLNILLDVDYKEGLAGIMKIDSNEGHGIWTKNVYMNNILQDNILHEIYLGILEEKLGVDYIHNITGDVPIALIHKVIFRFRKMLSI